MKKVIAKIIDQIVIQSEKKLTDELLDGSVLTYVDVGAAGGIKPRWQHYAEKVKYICFEPNKPRAVELLELYKKDFNEMVVHDTLCWDIDGNIDFYVTTGPNECSALKPNENFVKNYLSPERFSIEQIVPMEAKKLDSLLNGRADFIKVDVQGGAGEFLKGAEDSLSSTLGIEIEVEFFEVYQNQSLFHNVKCFLQKKGLFFEDFTELCRWNRINRNRLGGRLIHADALFLRAPEFMIAKAETDFELFRKYLAILLVYRRYDLISYCLENANIQMNNKRKILSKLNKISMKNNLKIKLASKISRLVGPGTVNYPSG